jgi:hypothetical protein
MPVWLSVAVSPWPGKCLAVDTIRPSRWYPFTWAATSSATSAGSDEIERTPITGLSGFTLTSASGAKSVVMPTDFSSRPPIAPAVRANAAERVAPSAIPPGNWVAGGPTRTTEPYSWSVPICSGMPVLASEAACKPFDSRPICCGSFTESVQAK